MSCTITAFLTDFYETYTFSTQKIAGPCGMTRASYFTYSTRLMLRKFLGHQHRVNRMDNTVSRHDVEGGQLFTINENLLAVVCGDD